MALRYHNETNIGNYSIDIIHVSSMLRNVLVDDNHFFYLSFYKEELAGMLWGLLTPPVFWTKDLSAVDVTFYVLPKYRGGFHGIKLLKAYSKWAVDNNCVSIQICSASSITAERTVQLYKKLGYNKLTYACSKEI